MAVGASSTGVASAVLVLVEDVLVLVSDVVVV